MRFSTDIAPEVLLAAKGGDLKAFEIIVSTFEQPIYNFIYYMLMDKTQADDVTQVVFIKLYTHIQTLDLNKSFRAWVFTIARRAVYDSLRERQKTKEYACENPEIFESKETSATSQIGDQLDMAAALQHIRPFYREVLLFYYWYGYSYSEIAAMFQIPLNSLKTALFRAKKAVLKELMK